MVQWGASENANEYLRSLGCARSLRPEQPRSACALHSKLPTNISRMQSRSNVDCMIICWRTDLAQNALSTRVARVQHDIRPNTDRMRELIFDRGPTMKAREMQLRRAAERQGLKLVKSRRRDPRAIGYGRWCLVSRWGEERVVGLVSGGLELVAAPAGRGGAERFAAWLTLYVVERFLNGDVETTKPERLAQARHGIRDEQTTTQHALAALP